MVKKNRKKKQQQKRLVDNLHSFWVMDIQEVRRLRLEPREISDWQTDIFNIHDAAFLKQQISHHLKNMFKCFRPWLTARNSGDEGDLLLILHFTRGEYPARTSHLKPR